MVLSNPELYAQLDVLKRIHSVARQTAQNLIAYRTAQIPSPSSNPNIPPLIFTPLDSILEPLSELDVSEDLRADLRQAFGERVSALQEKCSVNYKDACTGAPWLLESSVSVDKLRQTYQRFAHRQSVYLVESQLPYLQEEITKYKQSYTSADTKLTFNHEYTPVLEKYFEYNAYPSLPDRFLLAQKSHMNPRQIEVWFQNHRSRGRKDGTVLRRLSPHEASKIDFDELEKKVTPFVITKRARSTTVETSSSRDTTPEAPALLSSPLVFPKRPPHAFPTRYSETGFPDPFANQNGVFKFTPPEWQRRPATQPVIHKQIAMDELCSQFQVSLDLRGACSAKRAAKLQKKNAYIEKWFASIVTPKVDAPHPASVRSQYTRMPSSTPAGRNPHTWRSPTAISRRTHRLPPRLPSWAISIPSAPRWKEPGLPRRTPSTLPTYASNASLSRTPSLGSIASSDSASSSTTLAGTDSRSSSYSHSTLFEGTSQSHCEGHSSISILHFASDPATLSEASITQSSEIFINANHGYVQGSDYGLHDFDCATQSNNPFLSDDIRSGEMPLSVFQLESVYSTPHFDFPHPDF